MATDAPEEAAPAVEEEQEEKKSSGFWTKFAAVAGLLVLVMVGEFAMLFFVFGESSGGDVDPNDPEILKAEELEDTDVVEVDIASFNCSNTLSAQGQIIHITFDLCVEVPRNLSEQFTFAKKDHKNRIKQAVSTIIRNAGTEELNDPHSSTIKRQIREEINKILNQSYVTSVLITGFRAIEQ